MLSCFPLCSRAYPSGYTHRSPEDRRPPWKIAFSRDNGMADRDMCTPRTLYRYPRTAADSPSQQASPVSPECQNGGRAAAGRQLCHRYHIRPQAVRLSEQGCQMNMPVFEFHSVLCCRSREDRPSVCRRPCICQQNTCPEPLSWVVMRKYQHCIHPQSRYPEQVLSNPSCNVRVVRVKYSLSKAY